jgi:hypothetical protein
VTTPVALLRLPLLSLQFKDMPDVLAMMMRRPPWPGAGIGRHAAAAAELSGSATPAAAAAAAAASAAQSSGKWRRKVLPTEEEQEVMRELNLSDLTHIHFYRTKSSGAACWRVKLTAENLGFVHSEFCSVSLRQQPHPAQAGWEQSPHRWPAGALWVPGLDCCFLRKDPSGEVCIDDDELLCGGSGCKRPAGVAVLLKLVYAWCMLVCCLR